LDDEDVFVTEEMLDIDLVDLAYSLDIKSDGQEEEPKTMKQALSGPDRMKWCQALTKEFQAIADLGVFRLIPRREVPTGRRILTGKPVFRVKRDKNGNPTRWKAVTNRRLRLAATTIIQQRSSIEPARSPVRR
jgi:hypothetical protein